ncbi:MAG: YraN family protein, partial [Balneolaceae bacterium]
MSKYQKKTTRQIGHEAEELAAAYLESKDWIVLDRNYFFEKAEVDIVATDRNYIVFV